MLQISARDSQSIATAYSIGGTPIDVRLAKSINVLAAVTVVAPAAGTFTALASSDVMTKVAHGALTGLVVRVSNAGGALPTGLAAATDYWFIKIDADTFKLATSLVNALAGTAIDITTNGTGTQTITPTALAGASVKLQGCLDTEITASSVFADLPIFGTGDNSKSQSITATANLAVSEVDPSVCFIRAYYTLASGQLSVAQTAIVKGGN